MNKRFYPRLAAQNLRKNRVFFRPYLLALMGVVAGFYMMASTTHVESVAGLEEFASLEVVLNLGVIVVGVVSAFFLFYTNSFLMKQRGREFALYAVLGMSKRNILRMLLHETIYTALLGIVGGLIAGIVFDRLFLMILCRLVGVSYTGPLVYANCAALTAALFMVLLFFILLINGGKIGLSQPVALLYAKNTGEREPKARWLLALLGLALLGAGYYISITTQSPLQALLLFFIAVLLVIAGTFLLFLAGSVTLLKLLRKNKRYYYRTRHFISVSTLMYRMKRNAAGLAIICVLSTAVLVMISSTVTLYAGIQDTISARYPRQVMAMAAGRDIEITSEDILQSAEDAGFHPQNVMTYRALETSGLLTESGFSCDQTVMADGWNVETGVKMIFLLPISDYETLTGESLELADGKMLIWSRYTALPPSMDVFGLPMSAVGEAVQNAAIRAFESNYAAVDSVVLVVTEADFMTLYETQKEAYGAYASEIEYHTDFDLPAGEDADACVQAVHDGVIRIGSATTTNIGCRVKAETSVRQLFGGLLWLGIFLGVLFLAGTVLIIYYKQVSEGYEDRERFVILQKVGMTRPEVASVIRSQVLLIFFLPLGTAVLHMAAATPMILRLLRGFQFTNTAMFLWCVGTCAAVFALIYTAVYALTAKKYYKIVSN